MRTVPLVSRPNSKLPRSRSHRSTLQAAQTTGRPSFTIPGSPGRDQRFTVEAAAAVALIHRHSVCLTLRSAHQRNFHETSTSPLETAPPSLLLSVDARESQSVVVHTRRRRAIESHCAPRRTWRLPLFSAAGTKRIERALPRQRFASATERLAPSPATPNPRLPSRPKRITESPNERLVRNQSCLCVERSDVDSRFT